MSEKFQIGVGRYRHDLECSFSPEDDISLQSVSKSIFNSDINPKHMDMPTLNLISSKTKNMESLSDKIDTSLGKYVHDVQFSQMADLSDSSTHNTCGSDSNTIVFSSTSNASHETIHSKKSKNVTSYVHDVQFSQLANLSDSSTHESKHHSLKSPSFDTLCSMQHSVSKDHCGSKSNPITFPLTSNVARATIQTKSTKKVKPNFRKMHAEYVLAWNKNPPSNQPRPMRLMEFIFSHCNGENCSDSDDSIDIALKKARDKMGIRTKDLFKKPRC